MSTAPDVGAADPALLAALEAGDPARIYQSLHTARLLVAVIASPGQEHASEGDMALALLASGDGRQALPAFTSLAALTSWRAEARPVPRPASEVIAYAVAESLAAVILDPGVGTPPPCGPQTSHRPKRIRRQPPATSPRPGPSPVKHAAPPGLTRCMPSTPRQVSPPWPSSAPTAPSMPIGPSACWRCVRQTPACSRCRLPVAVWCVKSAALFSGST